MSDVADGEFEAVWNQLELETRDREIFGGGYDQPFRKLLEASRATSLRQFFPFTSMCRLCFARSEYPFRDLQPAFVEFFPGDRYIVRSGTPYSVDRDPPVELETGEPMVAIANIIRLLGI